MADKYLKNNNGRLQEVEATVESAGAANAGDVAGLDGAGRWHISTMPLGILPETISAVADGALSGGDFVNLYNATGVLKARKADATTAGKEADGFVLDAYDDTDPCLVYIESANDQRTGMTIGATQYLSTTPGGITETAPSASGNVVQILGKAVSATKMTFEPSDGIALA